MSDPSRKARVGGLGRGLSALLADTSHEQPGSSATSGRDGVAMLAVASLVPHPGQPRRVFDDAALEELAASIAAKGLIQPIVVRPHGGGYQIVAGERRWRAAQRARLHEVPVVIRDFDDAETLEVALLENIQRQDLNAIEEAEAYNRLILEFRHTQEELARIVHKSRSHVANLLRLLDLPSDVRSMVAAGQLSMGHARALIGASDALALAERVVAQGLSVRETERIARNAKASATPRAGAVPASANNADIAALEQQLADMLGLTVRIAHAERGGTLTLGYATLDQLDMLCQRLSGETI